MRPAILAVVTLTACASTSNEGPLATPTHLPNGRPGYSVQCSGSMSGCYEKAGEMCKGRGYEVVTQQQSRKSAIGFTGAQSQNVYDVLISCK